MQVRVRRVCFDLLVAAFGRESASDVSSSCLVIRSTL